ncbi:hypothetical protein D3C72_2218230 [compost metagenome]
MAILVRPLQDQIAGGHIDRAETADQTAGFRTGRIDMPLIGTVDELANGVASLASVLPQPQKHVVMAIENRLHSGFPYVFREIGRGIRCRTEGGKIGCY